MSQTTTLNFTNIYYGDGDLAGGFFVKNIMDNIEYIETNASMIAKKIDSISKIIEFLWVNEFKKMLQEIDSYKISDEQKKRIKEISKEINGDNKSFVEFINFDYKNILSKENLEKIQWYDLFSRIKSLIYSKFSSSISINVFEYIEENYPLNILASFEECKNYYSKKIDKFEKLFDGLDGCKKYDDYVYTDFLFKYANVFDKDFLFIQAEKICNKNYEYLLNEQLNSDNNNIVQILALHENYEKLANLYKLPVISQYKQLKVKIKETINDYLKKHGKHFDFGPVDLSLAIELLKKSEDPLKFLQLTHTNRSGKIENIFDDILILKNTSVLYESVSIIGKPRSNEFPYYKQDHMEISLSIRNKVIHLILKDKELLQDFCNFLGIISNDIENYLGNDIKFKNEIMGSLELLQNIILLLENSMSQKAIYKAVINGCAVNLCGTIEKLLRNIVINENRGIKYIDSKDCTISHIFEIGIKSISTGLCYYLKYYLSTENNKSLSISDRPGKNIRNIHMHNYDDKYESTDYDTCLILFDFVLSIINDFCILKVKNNEEK